MKNKMIPTPPQQQHLHNGITVEIRLKLKVNVYRKQTQTKQAQEIQERSKGVSPGIQNEQQDHGDEKQRGDPNKSRVGTR